MKQQGRTNGQDTELELLEQQKRDAKINYALDMVTHDLVSQGHLSPAKSYLLKTPEMREHIGRMCDRLKHRNTKGQPRKASGTLSIKKEDPASTDPSTKALLSNKGAAEMPTPKPNRVFLLPNKKLGETKPEIASSAPAPPPGIAVPVPNTSAKNVAKSTQDQVKPWITPRDIGDDAKRRSAGVSSGQDKSNKSNTNRKQGKAETIIINKDLDSSKSKTGLKTELTAQAYRAKVDVSGFTDDEISLDLDGRKFMISAQRPKTLHQNSRKMTETIEIPEGVNLENLKIGRRLDGSLLIEESVPGMD